MMFAIGFNSLPAATRDSLLPRRRVFPDLSAAFEGAIPAVPGRTFIIMSASSRAASFVRASGDLVERIVFCFRTLNFLDCSINNFLFVCAESAIIWKSFLCFSMIFRLWVPREPVEPRITIFFMVLF